MLATRAGGYRTNKQATLCSEENGWNDLENWQTVLASRLVGLRLELWLLDQIPQSKVAMIIGVAAESLGTSTEPSSPTHVAGHRRCARQRLRPVLELKSPATDCKLDATCNQLQSPYRHLEPIHRRKRCELWERIVISESRSYLTYVSSD